MPSIPQFATGQHNGPVLFFTVRLIPYVSAAALRQHYSRLIAVWYILRSINLTGSGIIDRDHAIECMENEYGYGQRTAYKALHDGEGLFWDTVEVNGRIRTMIHGVARVADELGIEFFTDRHFREIPQNKFATSHQRKAEIYASCHKPRDIHSHPISRAALEQFTGLSKCTQIRLERTAGVKKVPNYAVQHTDSATFPVKVELYGKCKVYTANKRLPNNYNSGQTPSNKGMLKKVCSPRSSILRGAPGLVKRYFSGVRRLVKAVNHRGSEVQAAYYKLPPKQRIIYGRQEWGYLPTYA